jgi:hypothetical protein
MKTWPITVVLLTTLGFSLPACSEPANTEQPQQAAATSKTADAALSLEQIRAKVGPIDVFHPMDGEPPGFEEASRLAASVKAAAASATDPEIKGELEVAYLRALQIALSALPMEPDKVAAEPYASWLKAQGESVFQDEISGSWLVPVSDYWTLADKYKDAAVGDAIAFHAANASVGGECEGLMSCNSHASLNSEGEYLKRFPNGKFTDMALDLVNNNMDTMLTDWDSQPEEQGETQKTFAEWETLLTPVTDSEMAKQVRGKLASLQKKPVAAATLASLQKKPVAAATPVQGEAIMPVAGGVSPTDTQDAEVVKAAEFAAAQMEQELDSIIEASQQVVAGMNYSMTLKLKNGETWVVTVYKDLQGQYSLSEYSKQ